MIPRPLRTTTWWRVGELNSAFCFGERGWIPCCPIRRYSRWVRDMLTPGLVCDGYIADARHAAWLPELGRILSTFGADRACAENSLRVCRELQLKQHIRDPNSEIVEQRLQRYQALWAIHTGSKKQTGHFYNHGVINSLSLKKMASLHLPYCVRLHRSRAC